MVLNNNNDNDNNVELIGLGSFLNKATQYLHCEEEGEEDELLMGKEQKAQENFVTYILTGRDPIRPDVPRTGIDVFLNSLTIERAMTVIQTCRDFDSLIGISCSLPYSKGLHVWPNPRFDSRLPKDNHLRKSVRASGLQNLVSMSLHAIPNIGFAGLHNDTSHHIVRLCFPFLACGEAPSKAATPLSSEQLAMIYDDGIRPVVEDILTEYSSYWPLTYRHESFRSARKKGGHVTTGVCVPADLVGIFGANVLERVRTLEFGQDAFFLHEFRGLKNESRHVADGTNPQAVRDALQRFLGNLKIRPPEGAYDLNWGLEGEWYIDVGIEINVQGDLNFHNLPGLDDPPSSLSSVLQWRRDAHQRLISAALCCTAQEAEEIARNREIDEVSHFAEIAGFRRVIPRVIATRLGVHYINCYTTDKNVTYLKDGNQVAKNTSSEEFLNTILQRRPFTYSSTLSKVFGDYSKREGLGSNARFEVRMDLSKALTVLWAFDTDVLQHSLLEFDNQFWWGWRLYRASAINCILQWQHKAAKTSRKSFAQPRALLLNSVMIWALNALNNRPKDDRHGRSLYEASRFRHGFEDNEPVDPFGVFMCKDILLPLALQHKDEAGRCPYLPIIDLIPVPVPAILFSFNRPQFQDLSQLCAEINPPDRSNQVVQASNKIRKTLVFTQTARHQGESSDSEEELSLKPPAPAIHIPNYTFQVSSVVEEDQITTYEQSELDRRLASTYPNSNPLERTLSGCWCQFLSDLTQKGPVSSKGSGVGYLRLSSLVSQHPPEDVYKTKDLSLVFEKACVWVNKNAWDTAKRNLFPEQGFPGLAGNNGPRRQSYQQMSYTSAYTTLLGAFNSDSSARNHVLLALHKRLEKLFWLPYASTERPWMTKTKNKPYKDYCRSFPIDSGHEPAPWVVINPKYTFDDVLWTYTHGPVPDVFIEYVLAGEGEEEEEER